MSQDSLPVATLLKDFLHKLSGQPENRIVSTTTSPFAATGQELELHRIANALERIAKVLESAPLTQSEPPINQPDYWITLPDKAHEAFSTEPVSTPDASSHSLEAQAIVFAPEALAKPTDNSTAPKFTSVAANSPQPMTIAPNITATPKITSASTTILQRQLQRQRIKLAKPQPRTEAEGDAKTDSVALYLGENFGAVRDFYREVKGKVHQKDYTIKYKLKEDGANTKLLRSLCHQFRVAKIAEGYTAPTPSNRSVQLKISASAHNFLTGEWLESYLYQKLELILKKALPPKAFEIMLNVELTVDTGKIFGELDLLFAIGEKIFCIEAKTNSQSEDLLDKLNRIQTLGIYSSQVLIIIAEKSDEECRQLSTELGGAKVICLANFETEITKLLK